MWWAAAPGDPRKRPWELRISFFSSQLSVLTLTVLVMSVSVLTLTVLVMSVSVLTLTVLVMSVSVCTDSYCLSYVCVSLY